MGIDRLYRVGIIGLGRMGSTIDEGQHADVPDSIASASAACERLEVVAGCDPDHEKCAAFSQKWAVSSIYPDYEEMLATEHLDLVAVCMVPSPLSAIIASFEICPCKNNDSELDFSNSLHIPCTFSLILLKRYK